MTFRILNFYSKGNSYLKHGQLVLIRWRFNSERPFCNKKEGGSSDSESDSSEDNQLEMNNVSQTNSLKKTAAKEKLANLLSEIQIENKFLRPITDTKLNLAKPPQRMNVKKEIADDQLTNDISNLEQNLLTAVKNIASTSASHSEEVESELIDGIKAAHRKEDTVITKVDPEVVEEVGENVMCAVKAIASTVVDNKEQEIVYSDLTKKLLALTFKKKDSQEASKENMIDLFTGMQIEGSALPLEIQVNSRNKQRQMKPKLELQKVNLFDYPPLEIFRTSAEELKDQSSSVELLLWDKLMQKELTTSTLFAPTNAFEEMIQLTEQGKHWKFPIDNESDIGAEENIGFHEHVFLDHFLEGFPKKGPVRHFMELVITALSKNPYITVDRKKENIEWFRQYFEEKKSLLQQYES